MLFRRLIGFLLFVLVTAVFSQSSLAISVNVQVSGGGRVVMLPGNADCLQSCNIQPSSNTVVSLFAIPNSGYRFHSWREACADTIGSLCTLNIVENTRLAARFIKVKDSFVKTKVLLLLHNEGEKNTIWNRFVQQQFANHCPVIYGGVILAEDSVKPGNQVHCYRIAFGYYEKLKQTRKTNVFKADNDDLRNRKIVEQEQLVNEIRAAVLGISNRHSKLSLALIGQDQAMQAAQAFLTTETAKNIEIVGLVGLHQDIRTNQVALPFAYPFKAVAVIPMQVGKISTLLKQMTDSWWMSRW